MHRTFRRAYPPAEPDPGPALWFPFRGGDLLVRQGEDGIVLAQCDRDLLASLAPEQAIYLGTLDGVPCLACEVGAAGDLPGGWSAAGLRALYGQLDEIQYALAGYASQMLLWQRTSRYCPSCGHATEPATGDWARRCPACGYVRYPPVSPAVLILVHDGDRLLLAHQPGWGKRYSILAGFVEPGESLEQCARREVHEEAALDVDDVTYRGSQPWPFPHQVMIGFWARYAGGEIRIDERELDDARWFRYDDLPELPAPLSLSRQLIDAWVASRRAGGPD